MDIDKIIEEFEARYKRYSHQFNITTDKVEAAHSLGYADGLRSALTIFYQLKQEGIV